MDLSGKAAMETDRTEPERSEYETAILDAFNNLAAKWNGERFFSDDQWSITHLPKSARHVPRTGIRKIIPGHKDDKDAGKADGFKQGARKPNFLHRIRNGVGTLVRDQNNLIFGESPNYDAVYPDEADDEIDTDNLHRYAQKLRELEDADREINPEFVVIRDGKPVYGVHETDADGNMKLSERKPIYDRSADQASDQAEGGEKRKLLDRLKLPFGRKKNTDTSGSQSPKPDIGTPNTSDKRSSRKATKKQNDGDMVTTAS
jgi:hypothetical protein